MMLTTGSNALVAHTAEHEQYKYRHSTAALEASAAGHAGVFGDDNLTRSEERGEVLQLLQLDNGEVDTRVDTGNNEYISTAAIASDNLVNTDTSVGVRTSTDFCAQQLGNTQEAEQFGVLVANAESEGQRPESHPNVNVRCKDKVNVRL